MKFDFIGCVIMASGLGKRFGGNKLMADFGGAPMIERILNSTDDLFQQRVVVTRHSDLAAYCRDRGIDARLHDLPHRSDTVRLGIEAMGADIQGCLFAPGDQPLLRRESIIRLCESFMEAPEYMHRLRCEKDAGLPIIFPRDCFEALSHLPQGKGGNVLLKAHPQRVRFVFARSELELTDVDTAEDLEFLLAAQQEL